MSLYAVKNDKGEWLYSDEYNDWVDQLSQATFYDTFEDADYDIECWELPNAYVVELVEAPEKVLVSEEEAEMLAIAKASYGYGAGQIATYAAEHHISLANETRSEMEDRLMRACVNGWTAEKPKRWNVKVPHTGAGWWYAKPDPDINHGKGCVRPAFTGINNPQVRLTDAEIIKYDLQDCEKREVKE